MQDIRYLLSIKELLEESTKEQLAEIAYSKLDSERRKKAQNITNEAKRAESIATGLLLQLGLQRIYEKGENNKKQAQTGPKAKQAIPLLTVSGVLAQLGEPIEPNYEYGENKKPYFREIPWYFNLSHSKEYVLCVLSQQEVGVDIQYKSPRYHERVLHRFFAKEERQMWENLVTQKERDDFFYQLWTSKEAFGKLTGEGIAKAISINVADNKEAEKIGVVWEDYDDLQEYAISICKWKDIKELDTK